MAVAVADLPRLQRRPLVRARLGDRDVDRHGLRARDARARRAALSRPAARVHAHRRRRRRHRRAGRDRASSTATRPSVLPLLARRRPLRGVVARRATARRARRPRLASRSAPPPGSRCSKSGIEPVVIGLAMGLLAYAYPAQRSSLERATERFREFREQPTAELARSATAELRAAISYERAAAAALPPVDELRDRAAVRARERRHRDQRRLPRAGVHARRSRSGSCSATSSASRSGSSAAPGC